MARSRAIDLVLTGLLTIDVLLTTWAFAAPELWFSIFHGVPYDDPQGLLRRCGANWAAFALFQGVALMRWKRAHHWVVVVAGIRLSDVFTDWTYMAFASNITPLGTLLLGIASPMNVVAGWWLLRTWRALREEQHGTVGLG